MTSVVPFMQPTYISVLVSCIENVAKATSAGDYKTAWDCLQTLWDWGPDCIHEEVGEDWKQMVMEINRANHSSGIDAYHSLDLSNSKARKVVRYKIHPLIQKVRKSLKPYLEKEGVQPKFGGDGKLRSFSPKD